MRTWVVNGVAQAWSNGDLQGWSSGGQHIAHVFWWHQNPGFHGAPTQHVVVDWQPGNHEAEAVAIEGLYNALPSLGADAEVQLLPFQNQAVTLLMSSGYTVLGHVLMGRTGSASERLVSALQPPEDLSHLGLRLAMARPGDTNAILTLQKDVFAQDPWACWFGANPHYLDTVVKPMLEGTREAVNYCIWRGSELVGSFGADIEREHPFWGDVAGVDFVLHRSIQQRGVVKTAYRCILGELLRRNVKYFRGGTLQPAVFRLAKVMGRYSVGLHLHRREVPQPPEHLDVSSFLQSS